MSRIRTECEQFGGLAHRGCGGGARIAVRRPVRHRAWDQAAVGGFGELGGDGALGGGMGFEPIQCTGNNGAVGEARGVGELQEDEGGGRCVAGQSTQRDFGPGAVFALEGGEVFDGAVDSQAGGGAVGQEGAEAEGGQGGVAPGAVGELGSYDGLDEAAVELDVGQAEFVEADDADGGRGGGEGAGGEARQIRGFDARGQQFGKNRPVTAGFPESL
jgi:hypothetical protein